MSVVIGKPQPVGPDPKDSHFFFKWVAGGQDKVARQDFWTNHLRVQNYN